MSNGLLSRLAPLVAVIVLSAVAGHATPAHGASFTVNSTHDAVDAAPGDGVCADAGGACTLRAAVMETNALAGADDISLPAGTYVLSIPPDQSCTDCGPFDASEGDLDIRENIRITGGGPNDTIVDGGRLDRVFLIDPPDPTVGQVVAEISGITIQNGQTVGNGGGVFNWGSLTLTETVIARNSAGGGGGVANQVGDLTLIEAVVAENSASIGGGITSQSGGTLTALRSTVRNNSASSGAGVDASGDVTIEDSVLVGNRTSYLGLGGAASFAAAAVTITNSTISGNWADLEGGGLSIHSVESDGQTIPSEISLINVTLYGNESSFHRGGGNIHTDPASNVTLVNTISANGGFAGDCSGPVTSLGHNFDSDGTCRLTGPGDGTTLEPGIAPLADNGGPTQTHELIQGGCAGDACTFPSAGIDSGDNAACPATDQRG